MPTSVSLPALGESVTEGTVTRWLKQVGDTVEVDEPLLEVSTDKVDTEIPSPAAGVLVRIVAEEDETVEIGAELAVIGDGSAAPNPAPPPRPGPSAGAGGPAGPPAPAGTHARSGSGGGADGQQRPAGRGAVRDAVGAQVGFGERNRPDRGVRHRGRRPDPQAGRGRRD